MEEFLLKWWPVLSGVAVAFAGAFWLLLRLSVREAVHSAMEEYRTTRECDIIHKNMDREVDQLRSEREGA